MNKKLHRQNSTYFFFFVEKIATEQYCSAALVSILFLADDLGELLDRVSLLRQNLGVVNLDTALSSLLRSRQAELLRNSYIRANRNGAFVGNNLLSFLAEEVINKLLGEIHVLATLEDSNRAGYYQQFGRIAESELCALLNLAVGDVVNAEAGGKLTGGGIVDNLAGALTDAGTIVMQLVEEIPTKLLLEEGYRHIAGTGESRVSNAESLVELRLEKIGPLGRLLFNLGGVDNDTEGTETSSGEASVIVIKRVDELFQVAGLVGLEDAFLLHSVEVRNLTGPDNICQNLAALTLSSNLRHELAGTGRLIVYIYTGVCLLEAFYDRSDEGFLHGRVDDQLLAVVSRSLLARAGTLLFRTAAAGSQKQGQHCDCNAQENVFLLHT